MTTILDDLSPAQKELYDAMYPDEQAKNKQIAALEKQNEKLVTIVEKMLNVIEIQRDEIAMIRNENNT